MLKRCIVGYHCSFGPPTTPAAAYLARRRGAQQNIANESCSAYHGPASPLIPRTGGSDERCSRLVPQMGRRSDKIALRKVAVEGAGRSLPSGWGFTPFLRQPMQLANKLPFSAADWHMLLLACAPQGKSDAKKAKIYGRVGKKIVSVVKAGGADPSVNIKLADLLRVAKDLGVPREILDRNISRASDKNQADFQEVLYEAYGPGGTGFLVACLTDNVNRSASEVKNALTKGGAKVAEPGSVQFNFTRSGMVLVEDTAEDAVFEAAMEAGADDVVAVTPEEEGAPSTSFKVFTSVEGFNTAKATLVSLGFRVNQEDSDLAYKPAAAVEVDEEAFAKCEMLLERLLDLDDVDGVFHNCADLDI
ncbi:hypothetical protein QJQ45_017972 [Haematococcus lacustris]|nr:hypothetical protein QJQ45_017972 [Haematococcus lacustris]